MDALKVWFLAVGLISDNWSPTRRLAWCRTQAGTHHVNRGEDRAGERTRLHLLKNSIAL